MLTRRCQAWRYLNHKSRTLKARRLARSCFKHETKQLCGCLQVLACPQSAGLSLPSLSYSTCPGIAWSAPGSGGFPWCLLLLAKLPSSGTVSFLLPQLQTRKVCWQSTLHTHNLVCVHLTQDLAHSHPQTSSYSPPCYGIGRLLTIRFLSSHTHWHQANNCIKLAKPTVMALSKISPNSRGCAM